MIIFPLFPQTTWWGEESPPGRRSVIPCRNCMYRPNEPGHRGPDCVDLSCRTGHSSSTAGITGPELDQSWASVCDAGPWLIQLWACASVQTANCSARRGGLPKKPTPRICHGNTNDHTRALQLVQKYPPDSGSVFYGMSGQVIPGPVLCLHPWTISSRWRLYCRSDAKNKPAYKAFSGHRRAHTV